MQTPLDSALDAVSEAQKRARLALFVALIASGAIIIAEWNSYLSWDRRWAEVNLVPPTEWGQGKVLEAQIASWQEANAVNVGLLGLRISVNDAPVIGSVILVIAAFYVSMCVRAENLEIGTLLHHVKEDDGDQRRYVFNRVRAGMVFNRVEVSDEPFESLTRRPTRQLRMPFAGAIMRLMIFLPAIATAIVIASEIYFAVAYTDSWRHLEQKYRIQSATSSAFAVICLVVIIVFQRRAWQYWRGTTKIVEEFEAALP